MKKFKKFMSVILAVIMILSTFSVGLIATAEETSAMDSPLSVTVSTDKNSYGAIGTAEVTVTVTNNGEETVEKVSAEALFDQLSPLGKNCEFTAEADSLEPGESVDFSYSVTLNQNDSRLNFFLKFFLMFKRVFYAKPEVKENGFDDGRACLENISIINFGGIEAENVVRVWYVDNSFELTVNEDEFYVSDESKIVYFYATTTTANAEIYLYDENDKPVAQMYDNGDYYSNGDDMQGDGVYSARVTLECKKEKTYSFYALNNNTAKTNVVKIDVIAFFSDVALEQMEIADNQIKQLMSSSDYKEKDEKGRAEYIKNVLYDMSNDSNKYGEALIVEESIVHNEVMGAFYFTYSCGAHGGVIYVELDDNIAGTSLEEEKLTSNIEFYTQSVNEEKKNVGEAVITYGWDNDYSDDSEFYQAYLELEKDWEAKGLDTTVKTAVTVEEYKTEFLDKELIVIAEHGVRYDFWSGPFSKDTIFLFSTQEEVSKETSKKLSADIKQDRVYALTLESDDGSVSTKYCLSPDFFGHYYEDKLTDSIIYLSSCMGFGEDQLMDYNFSHTFDHTCGASVTIGYHNSVYIWYGIFMLQDIVNDLLKGETVGTAIENAEEIYGETDLEFAEKYTQWDTTDHKPSTVFTGGDWNATLISVGLNNGSFEEGNSPAKWKYGGDVRIISKLGELHPKDRNKMAILTTGIGSKQDEYLSGTEGSYIEQSFIVPTTANTLSFEYNVVSEEPMEYVSSKFDDKFVAQAFDEKGNVIKTIAQETVNTSTWYLIEGIDFADGDTTTYHTMWKTANIDVSKYRGEIITLRFVVYDVGDSYYDTAALIDNVVIS